MHTFGIIVLLLHKIVNIFFLRKKINEYLNTEKYFYSVSSSKTKFAVFRIKWQILCIFCYSQISVKWSHSGDRTMSKLKLTLAGLHMDFVTLKNLNLISSSFQWLELSAIIAKQMNWNSFLPNRLTVWDA